MRTGVAAAWRFTADTMDVMSTRPTPLAPVAVPVALLGASLVALLGGCSDGSSGSSGSAGAQGASIERVLLVTCDTLRADRLGLYGCAAETSPRLDAFAAGARVFDEAYSTTSLTHPAMSALMTGRMPDEIGMSGGNRQHMPAQVVTLAELLEAQGITTAAVVSNWVLRSAATAAGTGIAQGFGHFDDEMDVRELNRAGFERAGPGTTDAALAWMESAGPEPYFLWVHYQDPHGPYTAPAEFERPAEEDPEAARAAGDKRLKLGRTHSGSDQLPNYQVLGEQRRSAFYRARYDAEVRYFDDEVGRLFDWLEEQQLLDSSLIIFTADHGESLGEHDYWFCHGETLARELTRVPLLVRSPRTTPGHSGALAGHLDILATVLDAFDLPQQPSRGVSLLAEDPGAGRALVQTLFRRESTVRREAVSDGRWRLLTDARGVHLFDVRLDPAEQRDSAASEPETVRRLQQQARQFWRDAPGAVVAEGAESALDDESLRALDALGYADGEERE